MRLLILGGTRFLGRHLVDAGRTRGHAISTFTRGITDPDLHGDVEKLQGDRLASLEALRGRQWDAVIDTSGMVPRAVRSSVGLLAGAGSYAFVSSMSVYADFSTVGMDESAPLHEPPPGAMEMEEMTPEHYAGLKAACEEQVRERMGERALIVRPGLIVGPYDSSDRFTWWVARAARGGRILAPGRPERRVTLIDARDLAEWIVRLAERSASGTFNASGPAGLLTMGDLVKECVQVSGSQAELRWVGDDALLEAGAAPWVELPLWLPETGKFAGFNSCRHDRALVAGLTFRPLAETIADTLSWLADRPADALWKAGLSPEREAELLARADGG